MIAGAYYNEHDKNAAAWLRALIADGAIAPGDVDERDIRDIGPRDLDRYTQCHFFAGIGVWSLALRSADWTDDRPIWTGSCPCQPFSAAGKRGGVYDERHLWPAFDHLIGECNPTVVVGEQVASPDGLQWIDVVSADLEGKDYAFGASDLCAAGTCVDYADSEEGIGTLDWIRGAVESCPDPVLADELRAFAELPRGTFGYGPPHIRQRLYWAAIRSVGLADTDGRNSGAEGLQRGGEHGQQPQDSGAPGCGDDTERLANNTGSLPGTHGGVRGVEESARPWDAEPERYGGALCGADWIVCTDGKARPTQSGIFPLADAGQFRSRVGLLRGAGNALHLQTAVTFLRSVRDVLET